MSNALDKSKQNTKGVFLIVNGCRDSVMKVNECRLGGIFRTEAKLPVSKYSTIVNKLSSTKMN